MHSDQATQRLRDANEVPKHGTAQGMTANIPMQMVTPLPMPSCIHGTSSANYPSLGLTTMSNGWKLLPLKSVSWYRPSDNDAEMVPRAVSVQYRILPQPNITVSLYDMCSAKDVPDSYILVLQLYTVSQKKVAHHTLRNIFAQGWPIAKISTATESVNSEHKCIINVFIFNVPKCCHLAN